MTLTLIFQAFDRPTASSAISRLSTAADGMQGAGTSENPVFSADGRYVLFESTVGTFVSGDTLNHRDIFRKDLVTGEIIRVSTSSAGAEGNGDSMHAQFSPDGRYVVFTSSADNLVSGDTNGKSDIFRKDLFSGAVIRLSTDAGRAEVGGDSDNAQFSPDGRYVLFQSAAADLVAGDANNALDIFCKDMFTGAIARISTSSEGTGGNGDSLAAQFSADGRYVVFESDADNLVGGDNNQTRDVFRKDLLTGEIIRISTDAHGGELNGFSYQARFSPEGRYVVFTSNAGNLIAGDTNSDYDVFRKDLLTGDVVRLSTTSTGAEVHGWSEEPRLSADGRYLVFASSADDVVAGDSNGLYDLFRKDLVTGEVIRLSLSAYGTPTDGNTGYGIAVSPDGRIILAGSRASTLVPGDTNGATDIFRIDATLMAHAPAVVEGRFVELNFRTGNASAVSLSWGDGTNDIVAPSNGGAAFSHIYAGTGVKTALATVSEGGRSWAVPYLVDLPNGQMIRNAAVADTLTGGAAADQLEGDGFANMIMGNASNDKLLGGAGDDKLYGGAGRDVLTGGSGHDAFVFDTKPNRKSNVDRIADFSMANDTIHLTKSVFTKIAKKGILAKGAFYAGTAAHDVDDRIIYNKKTGALYYDQDGTGSHAAIQIAMLTKNLKITNKDFFVI